MEKSKTWPQSTHLLAKSSFWVQNWCLFLVSAHDIRGKRSLRGLFYKNTNPFMRASPSWSKHLPKAHLWCIIFWGFSSVQFSSVTQSCPTLCDPMNRSTPGLPVHHQLLDFTQTRFHWLGDAIQPFHPLSSPSPPAPNPSQHQTLFQRVNSSHEVAKVLEFQL